MYRLLFYLRLKPFFTNITMAQIPSCDVSPSTSHNVPLLASAVTGTLADSDPRDPPPNTPIIPSLHHCHSLALQADCEGRPRKDKTNLYLHSQEGQRIGLASSTSAK